MGIRLVNRQQHKFRYRYFIFAFIASTASFILMTSCLFASQQSQFDQTKLQYQDTAKSMITGNKLQNKIKPQDYTKESLNNTATQNAKNYFDNPNAMNNAAKSALNNNKQAKVVRDFQTNNRQEIDGNNPAYRSAVNSQKNAKSILSEKTGSRYECKEVSQNCTPITTQKTCTVSNHQNISCMRYPKVEIVNVPYTTQEIFSGSLRKLNNWNYQFIPRESGTITSASITFGNRNHNAFRCYSWRGGFTIYKRYFAGIDVGSYKIAGCSWEFFRLPLNFSNGTVKAQANVGVPVSFSGGLDENIDLYSYRITMNVTRYKKEARITWVNNCSNVNKNACTLTKKQCVSGAATKTFQGVNVYQSCWQYDLSYSCGYKALDTCSTLANKCNYVSQTCTKTEGSFCLEYQKTYSCTQSTCKKTKLVCGNPNVIQMTQNFTSGDSQTFGKSVGQLAAVADAANDIKKANKEINLLNGKALDCGEAALGLYDCCDGGSGILKQCSKSEKKLKAARDKKLGIYVGRYCAKKALGVCLVHHQSWCVYDSRLARIIQEQGRIKQLGIGFGDTENPNCNGLSVNQFQSLDFNKMDLSELQDDLKPNNPSNQKLMQSIQNKYKPLKEMTNIKKVSDSQKPKYNKHVKTDAQERKLKDKDITYEEFE